MAGAMGGKQHGKGKAWSSCRRGHGGGARSGRRHVTTMKPEETATMDKHGAAARFSLWEFCLLVGDIALERPRGRQSQQGPRDGS